MLPFDDVAADRYAEVLVARENKGAPIRAADAQTAAICLAYGAACATRNIKDFVALDIPIINPWEMS